MTNLNAPDAYPYVVWTNYGLEGWQPSECGTPEEALRKREEMLSCGNSEVVITRRMEVLSSLKDGGEIR